MRTFNSCRFLRRPAAPSICNLACWVLAALLFALPDPASAADTLRISTSDAERLLRGNNLQLLAAALHIDASAAAITQAGLWNNPTVSITQDVYNSSTHRALDFTSTGNTDIQIQQLLLLAGKRGLQVRLAEIDRQVAGETYDDLSRELEFDLHTTMYDLYFLHRSLAFYDESIPAVRTTVEATEAIYSEHAILLSELLRLKSLLTSLASERLELANRAAEKENELRLLLGDTIGNVYEPVIDTAAEGDLDPARLALPALIDSALASRPDVRMAEKNLLSAETNLRLQQALAVPDVTVGGSWSRASGYVPNSFGISVSVDLPVFNRNQGAIAQAEAALNEHRHLLEQARQTVREEVTTAFDQLKETDRLYRSTDPEFMSQYQQLVRGTIANYERRNINIIEFTDFFEAYRTSMLQVNQLLNNRLDAAEQLNYSVDRTVIPHR